MTRRWPTPGDRVLVPVRLRSTAGTRRGILLRVDPHDWCDVLLDTGELLTRSYHIREIDVEPEAEGEWTSGGRP